MTIIIHQVRQKLPCYILQDPSWPKVSNRPNKWPKGIASQFGPCFVRFSYILEVLEFARYFGDFVNEKPMLLTDSCCTTYVTHALLLWPCTPLPYFRPENLSSLRTVQYRTPRWVVWCSRSETTREILPLVCLALRTVWNTDK